MNNLSQLLSVQPFYFLRILQDSPLLYTNSQKDALIDYVKKQMGITSKYIERNIYPEARDLKVEDLVYGGIVGNPKYTYYVTPKADGIRKLMVFSPVGVWYISPGNRLVQLLAENSGSLQGTILDGEDIPKEKRRIVTQDDKDLFSVFWAFDVLFFNNLDLRYEKDLLRRLTALRHVLESTANKELFIPENDLFVDPLLDKRIQPLKIGKTAMVYRKTFRFFDSVGTFYKTMQLMFLEEPNYPYQTDGFIFVPNGTDYTLDSSNVEPSERIASNVPDILRWKPVTLRTLDFYIDRSKERPVLLVSEINGLRPFQTPGYDPSQVDLTDKLWKSIRTGDIVEFRWDAERKLLVPTRIRADKSAPNRGDNARQVWRGIFRGVSQETLLGTSLELIRAYHNRIKRFLHHAPSSFSTSTLLDLGSGRGQDISKWQRYKHVWACEPNEEYRAELIDRLAKSDMKSAVTVLPYRAQETAAILSAVGQKVTHVSAMLSLSFFPTTEDQLALQATVTGALMVGGQFLFLTIDGDIVDRTFYPVFGSVDPQSPKFPQYTLEYSKERSELFVDLPGTIVTKQVEYPPFLTSWYEKWNTFSSVLQGQADGEKFLNEGEKFLSRLYSYGIWVQRSAARSELENEKLFLVNKSQALLSVEPSQDALLGAFLKAVEPEYQKNNTRAFRKQRRDQFRSELGIEETKIPETILRLIEQFPDCTIIFNKVSYGTGSRTIELVSNEEGIFLVCFKEPNGWRTLSS